MDNTRWKSDKTCIECKREYRKEIIKEIRLVCKDCRKLNKIDNPTRDKKYRKPRRRKKGR